MGENDQLQPNKNSAPWPFEDLPNVATFTSRHVLEGAPICFVYHGWDDGAWQFLPDRVTEQSDAKLVCLKNVFEIDASIGELADLPEGWMAKRADRSCRWERSRDHPYPVFADDGFYLDDATIYETLYPETYTIPAAAVRTSLQKGQLVKLIFRFADEWSSRQDNECERMWVEVIEVDDENGCYKGSLRNDPHLNQRISFGHEFWFHPVHVFAVEDEAS
ncbi:MAG: hypothetical protein V4662_08430 [Verrucomicrobiota bacterium]